MTLPTQPLTIQSRAKLNWYLRVLDKREDGFHDLETIFQDLELSDELTFTAAPEREECIIQGFPDDVPSDTNLVKRAWQLLRSRYPGVIYGLNVRALKNIPRGGGLGGGSSNAAATLLALNSLYGLQLSAGELETIGASLGSDVPFFVRGATAIGRGRGELLESMSVHAHFHLVLVLPGHGISTAQAYQRLDDLADRQAPHHSLESVQRALLTGNAHRLAAAIYNDFESAVAREPWFRRTVSALDDAGCLRAFLCGSGSTVAALAESQQHCTEIITRLNNIIPYTRLVTCTLARSGAEVR